MSQRPLDPDLADAARHLRLMLHRRELLGSREAGDAATRWPAWRLYDSSGR